MKNDSLFVLIRSLSKNEKGYFKKNTRLYSTNKENHYLTLFEVIDKMEAYDEKELKLRLKGEKWIKNLPALKSYLFLQILRILEAYQNSGGKDEDAILSQTDILVQRGLYAEAHDMLKKGQALAESNENFYQLLHSLDREVLILRAIYPATDITDRLIKIKQRRDAIMQSIRDFHEITDLNDHVYRVYENTGTLRKEDSIAQLSALIDQDRIRWIESARSRKVRMAGYNMLTAYFYLRHDLQSAFIYSQKLFHLAGRGDGYFDRQMIKVYTLTYNFLQLCITSGNFKEFEKNIKYFENMKAQYSFSSAKKFFLLHYLYFTYLHTIHRPADIHTYLPRFRRDLRLYESSLSSMDKMGLFIHISHLLFLNGDISESIDWNNRALDCEKQVIRQDYLAYVRIHDLILHYEAGSYRLLDSKLLSAQRYLRKKSVYFKTERCILSYIRQLSKASAPKERIVIFRAFKNAYNEVLEQSHTEKAFGDFFRLPEWIDRKIKELS